DLFTEITATGLVQQSEDAITITDEAKRVLAKEGLSNYRLFPFTNEAGAVLVCSAGAVEDWNEVQNNLSYFIKTQEELLTYQKQSDELSDRLSSTFVHMLRQKESLFANKKYHTPRVVALAESFASLFGLDASEKEQLLLTA